MVFSCTLSKEHTANREFDPRATTTQVRLLLNRLPSVEKMQRCILLRGAGNPSAGTNADDSIGGVALPHPAAAGETPVTGTASAAEAIAGATDGATPGAAAGAIAVFAATTAVARAGRGAVPGAGPSVAGASAAAGGGDMTAAKGAGTGREPPSENISAALNRALPLLYPLLQWLLSR